MLPDRVSNPGPLTYESGALPVGLRSLARPKEVDGMPNSVEMANSVDPDQTAL